MARCGQGVYGDQVTSADASPRPRRVGLGAVVGALSSWRSARATLLVLAGLPISVLGFTVTVCLPIGVGYSAAWSLLYAPGGDWLLTTTLVLATVAMPVPLLWGVKAFSAAHWWRFRTLAGVPIDQPPPAVGSPLRRLLGQWGAAATWRTLAYHALAIVTSTLGAVLVLSFWSAAAALVVVPVAIVVGNRWEQAWLVAMNLVNLTLVVLVLAMAAAAPRVARWVARVELAAARALLGPSRTEVLSARVDTLANSRSQIVAAADAERRRIERDLHDGAQQRLVSLAMNLGIARENLAGSSDPARTAIEQAHDEAIQALTELREFVRGLHPAVLNDRGLDAALSGIAARAPIPVRVHVAITPRCSPIIEAVAYFIVAEALTNIAKHAHASHAEVTVIRAASRLRIVVTDDGRGGATLEGTGKPGDRAGSGLRGLA